MRINGDPLIKIAVLQRAEKLGMPNDPTFTHDHFFLIFLIRCQHINSSDIYIFFRLILANGIDIANIERKIYLLLDSL